MKLALERLSKQFKNKIAVEDVSTVLTEGIYGFLGANGAGKTTLIQMICGIVEPTAGEVKLDGKNTISMGEDFRDLLGYLPQEFGYTPGFTAKDFMLYISSIKGLEPRFARKRTEELLRLVNLEDEANHKVRTFSGGMKRRLGIAQALLNDPRILILDEPTAGLDPKERIRFRNIISALSRDRIIILSTHIVSDVEYIADEILLMKAGELLAAGNIEHMLEMVRGKVWECYVRPEDTEKYQAHFSVSNLRNTEQGARLRIVSDMRPLETAVPADPDLEDVYLYYFREEMEHA